MKTKHLLIAFLVLILISCTNKGNGDKYSNESTKDKSAETSNQAEHKDDDKKMTSYPSVPVITHHVYLKTGIGRIILGLYGDDVPETVANFIGLTKMRYYNGVLIHRVARNFLIQMGDNYTKTTLDRTLWGTGGETFDGGELLDELNPETPSYKIGYEKGVVAMANKGPRTATSQFFICLDEAKNIKHNWTIFGRVIDGMDVVEKISQSEIVPGKHDLYDGIPIKPVKIINVKINFIKAPQKSIF